jgi:hypothetical protein
MNSIYANPEPSQSGNILEGVTSTKGSCEGLRVGSLRVIGDDQRPGPCTKGMMCSDLPGNRQRAAEMTAPLLMRGNTYDNFLSSQRVLVSGRTSG